MCTALRVRVDSYPVGSYDSLQDAAPVGTNVSRVGSNPTEEAQPYDAVCTGPSSFGTKEAAAAQLDDGLLCRVIKTKSSHRLLNMSCTCDQFATSSSLIGSDAVILTKRVVFCPSTL